jgi:ABC-2 type transport system permease protein
MIWINLKYTFKRELRDIVSMILLVIFPIILACIVGNALKSDFELPKVDIQTFAVVHGDENDYMNSILEVLHTDALKDVINATQVDTIASAERQFKSSDINGYIYQTEDGANNKIGLYVEDPSSQGAQIVKYAIEKYNIIQAMYTSEIISHEKFQIISDLIDNKYTVEESLVSNHKPKSFDYYGITLTVLICLYGSLYAIKIFSETIIGKHGARIKSITSRKFNIALGILLASFILVCIQVLVLLLFYRFVYGVYLGDNLKDVFIILVVFIAFTNFFGASLISVCKNYSIAYMFANIIILAGTFLASGFVILDLGNGILGNIVENYLPNALCQNALFSVIYKTDAVDLTRYLSIISIWSAALLIVTLITNRRDQLS